MKLVLSSQESTLTVKGYTFTKSMATDEATSATAVVTIDNGDIMSITVNVGERVGL